MNGDKAIAYYLTINDYQKFQRIREELLKLKQCDYILCSAEKIEDEEEEVIHVYIHFKSAYKLNNDILSYNPNVKILTKTRKDDIEFIREIGSVFYEKGKEPKERKDWLEETNLIKRIMPYGMNDIDSDDSFLTSYIHRLKNQND